MASQMTSSTRIERGTLIVDVVGHVDLGSSPALRKTLLESLKSASFRTSNSEAIPELSRSEERRVERVLCVV